MRLIDADALKEDIMQSCLFAKEWDYALVEQAIDAQFTIKPLLCDDGNGVKIMDSETLAEIVKNAYHSGYEEGKTETIDAVPVGAYEQTRWERDTAIEQLAEIGKSLCEKMDNVATVVRCKDCKYYRESKMLSPQKFCFRSKSRDGIAIGYNFAEDDFCSYGERSEYDNA